MDENDELDNDKPNRTIIPAVRVIIGAVTPDGDFLNIDELMDWLSQKGCKQTVVDLLESGIGGYWVTDPVDCEKVL